MKYLIDFFVGFARGGFFVIFIVTLLFMVANVVFGDDNVTTREATLGEQDRSLNYNYMTVEDEEVEFTITVVVEKEAEAVMTCEENNAILKASRDYAEKRIADNPKYRYLYNEVLELIEERWCHDNDN